MNNLLRPYYRILNLLIFIEFIYSPQNFRVSNYINFPYNLPLQVSWFLCLNIKSHLRVNFPLLPYLENAPLSSFPLFICQWLQHRLTLNFLRTRCWHHTRFRRSVNILKFLTSPSPRFKSPPYQAISWRMFNYVMFEYRITTQPKRISETCQTKLPRQCCCRSSYWH